MTPPGQRDYSTIRISRHALERFIERFAAVPESADEELRRVLSRTRRLGRNPENGAIAILAVYRSRVLDRARRSSSGAASGSAANRSMNRSSACRESRTEL